MALCLERYLKMTTALPVKHITKGKPISLSLSKDLSGKGQLMGLIWKDCKEEVFVASFSSNSSQYHGILDELRRR